MLATASQGSGHPRCVILLVEDNARDIRITREALRVSEIDAELLIARDGEEALRLLRQQPPHAAAPTPDLVFLDINLPGKNGREVLAEIKQDEKLRMIPVLMLTTSAADSDLRACYQLHANSYHRKPFDFDEFVALVRAVYDYWVRRAVPAPKLTALTESERADG